MINKFVDFLRTEKSRAEGFEAIVELCIHLLDFPTTPLKIAAIETLSRCSTETANSEKLADKLIEAKLFENLFVNPKGEVLKRSESLIVFVARKGRLSRETAATVWNCFVEHVDKAEAEVIVDVWKVLLPYCDAALVAAIGERLRKVDVRTYNQSVLKFVEHFTKRLEELHNTVKKEIFDVRFFWNLVFDGKLPESLKAPMLDIFLKSAGRSVQSDCTDCVRINFMEGVDIEICMQFLLKINYFTSTPPKEVRSFLIACNCVDRCIEACEDFHKKAIEEYNSSGAKMRMILTLNEFLCKADIYLEFLHTIYTTFDEYQLGVGKMNKLWNLYYINALYPQEADLFWSKLSKENGANIGFFNKMDEEVVFFAKYLQNPKMFNIKGMKARAFDCFMKYFNRINAKGDIDAYTGVDFLWEAAVRASDYTMRQKVTGILMGLYYDAMVDRNEISYSAKTVRKCLERVFEFKFSDVKEFKAIFALLTKLISK